MNELRTESFGARLARLREDAGISQSALARRINASQSAISQIEGGDRNPSYTMLCDLAEALGLSTAYLVGAEVEGLTADEVALFRRYRSLPEDARKELSQYTEYLHTRHGKRG
ncbi:MAG: helix-turn-helix domain-containing protein [Longimicrobiaceae bacterium]